MSILFNNYFITNWKTRIYEKRIKIQWQYVLHIPNQNHYSTSASNS